MLMYNPEQSKQELVVLQNRSSFVARSVAVIPCFNEEAAIEDLVVQTKRFVDVVVVVDDGSSDRTAEKASHVGAVVLRHAKNKGKGAALKTGFAYALSHGFAYVVTMDGDGQHNPVEIPAVLDNVMNNGHDMSIGYRVGDNTEMPMWRRVGKRVLDYATSLGTGGFVADSQCGFRAFNKKAIEALTPKLKADGFSVESEQLIKAHESGLKVINTNVTCKYKDLVTSTKHPAAHGLSVLAYIIWVIAKQSRLSLVVILGFMFMVVGLMFGF